MSRTITGDQLTNALRALDVNFIMGGQIKGESLHKQPARLIIAAEDTVPNARGIAPAVWASVVTVP